jgi:hypothetical protein
MQMSTSGLLSHEKVNQIRVFEGVKQILLNKIQDGSSLESEEIEEIAT